MTAAEYLRWEAEQQERHEFHDGEIYAMAGGSPRHNALCAAVIIEMGMALRGSACRVLTGDQKVSLSVGRKYVYPDASVICGDIELEEGTRDVVTNPRSIVEVLSSSTEAHDRGAKWDGYRRLASLADYVLVSQRAPAIEHFSRQDDGAWRYTVAGPGQTVRLAHGAVLSVDAVYDGAFDMPGE